jgi:hypothetical protein
MFNNSTEPGEDEAGDHGVDHLGDNGPGVHFSIPLT